MACFYARWTHLGERGDGGRPDAGWWNSGARTGVGLREELRRLIDRNSRDGKYREEAATGLKLRLGCWLHPQ